MRPQAKEMREVIRGLREELQAQSAELREAKVEVERLIAQCAPLQLDPKGP